MATITYEQFRMMLRVNKHRLDDELEIQPELLERIGNEVNTKNSRQIELKSNLEQVANRLAEDIREDEPKLTIGAVDAKVKREAQYKDAWVIYQSARAEHDRWSTLLEAWRNRSYSIKTLSDLYSAQYFSLNSTQIKAKSARTEQEAFEEGQRARAGIRAASVPKSEPAASTRRQLL